ncbi:MAG: hypothetical protein Q7S30_00580 [Candidatus Omnitrophota bacterium]|nr:hypothetical protein [Candidatus Omnitrophota bacterium]
MKIIILVACIIGIILAASFSILAYLDRPCFELINHAQKDIKEIEVFWNNKTMKAPNLKAGAKEKIYINTEAAAKFVVMFTDSKIIESDAIYFTNGIMVSVDIYDNEIKLAYQLKKT